MRGFNFCMKHPLDDIKRKECLTLKDDYRKLIYTKLKKSGKKPVRFKELLRSRRKKQLDFDKFVRTVEKMKAKGEILENKTGFTLVDKNKLAKCTVARLNRTYGFVTNNETGEEIFVPGKRLRGSMPGDVVLVRTYHGSGNSTEGEVIRIVEENFTRFTGEIVSDFGTLKILPDVLSKFPIRFSNPSGLELHEGDKVMAKITKRGENHAQHCCEVLSNFGSAMKASVCALSILEANDLTADFPADVLLEAKQVSDTKLIEQETPDRLDLRDKIIFTIDGADTKDIDDAISVEKNETGYALGVHIADVSHYVQPKSLLDNEAFKRGTSIYYANRVIPMLPKELSNGICSLNPNEDRLAFSALIELDENGEIQKYNFAKTVIRSRVQGVYSEINSLLDGDKSKELREKYAEVIDVFPVMTQLADLLAKKKRQRGAPMIDTPESKLIIDENDICVDVIQRVRGVSEEIIEDFMLTANECAARFGIENNLPFVYRVHENPSDQKLEDLKDGLTKLNIPYTLNGDVQPKDLAGILEKTRGESIYSVVNNLVLRSMSKAKYSTEPLGHFGLVLEDYAHFTSPIRRYPDLTIHRIMSSFLSGLTAEECNSRYQKFVYASADQSTSTELKAMNVERDCEDCYKAEYMKNHIGKEYEGIISSVTDFGIFILLPNTCEGLLHIERLGEGEYYYDGSTSLKNLSTGELYKVGDEIAVKVLDANVSLGKIDFALPGSD